MSTTSEAYERYVGDPGENYQKYFVPTIGEPAARRVVETADVRPGETVVDVACGTGIAARLVAGATGSPGEVIGVDPVGPMLEVARRVGPGIRWLQGRAEELPLEPDKADVVICSQGYQFFSGKPEALREMTRVLRSGGRAVIGTPGPIPEAMIEISETIRNNVSPEAAGFVSVVFSVHDPGAMEDAMSAAGFTAVQAENRPLTLRVPPPADFFWQYVTSTPLAGVVSKLDPVRRAALEEEVIDRCARFVEDDGMTIEPGFLVATGRLA